MIDSVIPGASVEINFFKPDLLKDFVSLRDFVKYGGYMHCFKKDGQLFATHSYTNYNFRLLQFRRLNS